LICPHLEKKYDTFNTPNHTRNTTKPTAYDKIHQSEVTIESVGLAPKSASLRKSVQLTLDAARRTGSHQTYRAFGRIKPINLPRGQRSIATTNNKTTQKLHRVPKNIRATRALLCLCLYIVLKFACIHDPPTEQYPSREIPLPHLAGTIDP
jgi:hypothetical protein